MDDSHSRWHKSRKGGSKAARAAKAREVLQANQSAARAAALTSAPRASSSKSPPRKKKKNQQLESPSKRSVSTQTNSNIENEDEDEESEDEDLVYRLPTASERKLSQFNELLPLSFTGEKNLENLIVSKSSLLKLFTKFKCNECKEQNMSVEFEERKGFCHQLSVKCQICGNIVTQCFTSSRVKDDASTRPPFSVNRHICEAFISLGVGYAAMESFCENMSMECMTKRSFHQHLTALTEDYKKFREEMLQETKNINREEYELENPTLKNNSVIDISVSYDGSWQKRGFTSNYGVGFVVDIKTGLIVDFACASKYCHACVLSEKAMGIESEEYEAWHSDHKASGLCNKKYDGSSKSMEVAIAKILWDRSEVECKMRYTTVLCDGDASTFNHLVNNNPYDVPIEKEECINHVSKRLSTALKNKVVQCKTNGVTLGGAGAGQLTENVILKLASFYRNAIVNNKDDVKKMKKSIMATPYHSASTDKKNNHTYCPVGENSWCFYQRANALKKKTSKP